MGDVSLIDGQGGQSMPPLVQINDGGAANTFGAWGAISAALPIDVSLIRCYPALGPSADTFLLSYGTGAAGSEVELFTLPIQLASSVLNPVVDVPVRIGRGQRLSARLMSAGGSKYVFADHNIFPIGSMLGSMPLNRPTLYGAASAFTSTLGTAVTTGATQNAGAWTALTASTTVRTRALILLVTTPDVSENIITIDLGIGPAGSEVTLIDKTQWYTHNGISYVRPSAQNYPLSIVAGTRVSVRATSPLNAGTFTVHVSMIGLA